MVKTRSLVKQKKSPSAKPLVDARRVEEASRFITSLYRGILRREPDRAGLTFHVERVMAGRSWEEIVENFVESKEFRRRSVSNLFRPPGHFYSPIVDPAEAAEHLSNLAAQPVPEQLPDIALDRRKMVATWASLLPLLSSVPFPEEKQSSYR